MVLYPFVIRGKTDLSKNETSLKRRYFYNLPPHLHFFLSRLINSLALIFQNGYILRKTDIIWLTHPCYFSFIKILIRKDQKIIYDVMDDFLEFPSIKKNKKNSRFVKLQEAALLNRADLVVCSADSLKLTLQSRHHLTKDIFIIKNAMHLYDQNARRIYANDEFDALHLSFKIATYIGAISQWFDFNSVLTVLDVYQDLVICLFGPKDADIPLHPRIKYFGIIKHEEVFDVMQKSDFLIMPFIVTELIKSVNPVKLYEYISSGKPVIAVRYKEIEEFQDYVYLYKNVQEFVNYLNKSVPKKSVKECIDFASKNTWEKRCEEIIMILLKFLTE